jgi:hypothetical protein
LSRAKEGFEWAIGGGFACFEGIYAWDLLPLKQNKVPEIKEELTSVRRIRLLYFNRLINVRMESMVTELPQMPEKQGGKHNRPDRVVDGNWAQAIGQDEPRKALKSMTKRGLN